MINLQVRVTIKIEKESKLLGYLADDLNADFTLTDSLSDAIAELNRNREISEPCDKIAQLNPSAELPSKFLANDEDNLNLQTMRSSATNAMIELWSTR